MALADFSRLLAKFDFVAEGREAFAEHFKRLEAEGGDPTQTMCFVWYLDDGESSPKTAQSYPRGVFSWAKRWRRKK
jgi:hypothetical protein